MNYRRIYKAFIRDRREKEKALAKRKVRTEVHHILPRSIGGTNKRVNLITLTLSDHFFAHELLARIHKGKMWTALHLMSGRLRYRGGRSRRLYATARKNHVALVSRSAKGQWESKEFRGRQSRGLKRYYSDPKNRAARSAEMKARGIRPPSRKGATQIVSPEASAKTIAGIRLRHRAKKIFCAEKGITLTPGFVYLELDRAGFPAWYERWRNTRA